MPFTRPTLSELNSQMRADVEADIPGAEAGLRRSFLSVITRALAGIVHQLFDFQSWISRQPLPDTADEEILDRWADIWDVIRRPAIAATGNVTFTGTNGSIIPAGTTLQRSDGAEYTTSAEVTIASGTATAAVTAAEAGSAGNADAAVALSFASPVSGVSSAAAVSAGGLTQGAEAETDTSLRARVIARIQQPPHGGAKFDYLEWVLDQELHGIEVTNGWIEPLGMGLGTVIVRFMMYDTYADGIPQSADVAAVQAAIDLVRPVTADVTVAAPVALTVNFEISGLSPSTSAVQAAIEAELADLFRREAEPGGTILISHIREAISIAAGESDHVLVSPAANVEADTGEIPVVGSFTWS
jgi:uncharacterized phage protein gp47/JayE